MADMSRWLHHIIFGTPLVLYFDKGGPPAPPPVPDPNRQIQGTRYNVEGPMGGQQWSGPNAPDTTLTQTLSPEQQQQLNLRNQISEQMLGSANTRASGLPGSTFSFNTATPEAAKVAFAKQKELLDPIFERGDKTFEQKMTNAGIPVGSDAYNEALRQHEQDKNFAYSQAAKDSTLMGTDLAMKERQEQLNEIAQIMGGTQLTPFQPRDTSNPDAAYANQQAGLNRMYQGQLAGYNADVARQNAMMQGMFGLGAAALLA